MSKESKLVDLRRKTDRDLMILVQRELNRGLALARLAAKESGLCGQADGAYQFVKTWLPLICALSHNEREQFDSRLQELQTTLERLRADEMPRPFAGAAAA